MTAPDDLYVVKADQLDPRLGRNVVHDPRSRRFEALRVVDLPTRSFLHRYYDPRPNPNQTVGCCTGCAEVGLANTVGNRVKGQTLGMGDALRVYSRATQIDPWTGQYPPEDTGSSGLAAAKAAQEFGIVERYEWVFGSDDVFLTVLRQHPISVGTWWYDGMFDVDPGTGLVEPTGQRAGGHQWRVLGWDKRLDAYIGLCWWGRWGIRRSGRFTIRRKHLHELRMDDGDAHISRRAGQNA